MTRAPHLSRFDSVDLDVNSTFNVVIAYEDFETGKHAKKTYDFLADNLGHDCRFTNQMWKFEVLSIPKLREIAAKDAANADIVMISCHGRDLPPEVRAWLELWLAEPTHPIALVALFDRANPEDTAEVRSYLASVATRGQMEFFAQPDEWPGSHKQNDWMPLSRTETLNDGALSILASGIQQDRSFSRWGINE